MMMLFGNRWIQSNKVEQVYVNARGMGTNYAYGSVVILEINGEGYAVTPAYATEEEAMDKAKVIAKMIDEADD